MVNIQFRPVTPENWRIVNSLRVQPEQQPFVAENVTILARAFAYREHNSKVHVVCMGDQPIGLIMQRDWSPEKNTLVCILDQFMIDGNFQGQGYGKKAMQLWLSMIREENRYHAIELCYVQGDAIAATMYKGLGFIHKPDADSGDELVMIYPL